MNHDRELRRRLLATLPRIQAPEPSLQDVVRRNRRLRTRQVTATLVVAGLLSLAVVVPVIAFTIGSRSGPGESTSRPAGGAATTATPSTPKSPKSAPRAGWTWHSDSPLGVAIQAPSSWTLRPNPFAVSSPTPLFALGTGSVPAGGDCAPTTAIHQLAKTGALIWVLEYGRPENPYEFAPRPQRFNLGPLTGPFECVGERTHSIMFRQAGRFFQAHVLFGAEASSALRAEVVSALSSFSPQPQGTPFSQLCRQGPWINCPEASWVFQMINQAGYFHWGNTGSAIQASPSQTSPASGRITIWTSRASNPGAPSASYRPLTTIAGTNVYADGSRLVWQAQGFNIWVQLAAGGAGPGEMSRSAAFRTLVGTTVQIPFVNDQG